MEKVPKSVGVADIHDQVVAWKAGVKLVMVWLEKVKKLGWGSRNINDRFVAVEGLLVKTRRPSLDSQKHAYGVYGGSELVLIATVGVG